MPEHLFDGKAFDVLTLLVAFLYASVRSMRRRGRDRGRGWEAFTSDLSYGVSIWPMLVLACVAFSSEALRQLQEGNKVIMSLAGLISLVVLVRRSFEKPEDGPGRWL